MDEFRSGFTRLMYVVGGVGLVGTVGAWLLGPFAVELLYDAELSRRTLAVLALGSACYMFGVAIAQAVIALHGHAQVAMGWTAGMVAFVVSTWLIGGEVFRRVELAVLIGSATAMIVFVWALRSRLRSGAVPSESSMLEAMTDMPFEA